MEPANIHQKKIAAVEHIQVGMDQLQENLKSLFDAQKDSELESQICELVSSNVSFMFDTLMRFVRESQKKIEMREILLMIVHEYRLQGFESQFDAAQTLAEEKEKQKKLLEEKKNLESQLKKEKLEKLKAKADLDNIQENKELQLKKRVKEIEQSTAAEL